MISAASTPPTMPPTFDLWLWAAPCALSAELLPATPVAIEPLGTVYVYVPLGKTVMPVLVVTRVATMVEPETVRVVSYEDTAVVETVAGPV
jgi:hypothetical protein